MPTSAAESSTKPKLLSIATIAITRKVKVAMAETPAASPSSPSIRLMVLVTPTIHTTDRVTPSHLGRSQSSSTTMRRPKISSVTSAAARI
ncbi:MAG: hypothetical protein BWY76_02641 [bacterium ADurb.Bin429]|nr:MAG: hypothetical protein BWY76_02641 [bacterium ADurb.Bin429]